MPVVCASAGSMHIAHCTLAPQFPLHAAACVNLNSKALAKTLANGEQRRLVKTTSSNRLNMHVQGEPTAKEMKSTASSTKECQAEGIREKEVVAKLVQRAVCVAACTNREPSCSKRRQEQWRQEF